MKRLLLILSLVAAAWCQPIPPPMKQPCTGSVTTNCTPQVNGSGSYVPATTGSPTGAAGGALSGTYPNPAVRGFTTGATDPPTCTPGVTLDNFNTTSGAWKYCSATNTWSAGRSVIGNFSVGTTVLGTTIIGGTTSPPSAILAAVLATSPTSVNSIGVTPSINWINTAGALNAKWWQIDIDPNWSLNEINDDGSNPITDFEIDRGTVIKATLQFEEDGGQVSLINHSGPVVLWSDSAGGTNKKSWRWQATGGNFNLDKIGDNGSNLGTAIQVQGNPTNGGNVQSVAIPSPARLWVAATTAADSNDIFEVNGISGWVLNQTSSPFLKLSPISGTGMRWISTRLSGSSADEVIRFADLNSTDYALFDAHNHVVYIGASTGNTVYRCATAGATLPTGSLTTNASACGTTADTALRLQ